MHSTINLSWHFIKSQLQEIDVSGKRIYGIPRGGMILAGFLENATNVCTPEEADIFIDDIRDSGHTAAEYDKKYPGKSFWALIDKQGIDKGMEEWVIFPWETKQSSIEDAIIRQLQFIGEDPSREGLLGTPERVIRSWKELYGGYGQKVEDLLTVFEDDSTDEMVLLKDIELYSVCEHHMLPFVGKAHIAYIPDGRVIGISKLARILEMYSRRLQIQERLCQQVTDALMTYLRPKGAACIIEAQHLCMKARGVQKQNSIMTTSSLQGVFKKPEVRAEFLQLIKG